MGPQKSQLDSRSEKIPGTNNTNQHNKKIKKNNFRVAEFRSLKAILRITLEDARSSKMLV